MSAERPTGRPATLRSRLVEGAKRRLWPDVLIDRQVRTFDAAPEDVWHAAVSVGGRNGYAAHDWLWRIRGALDRVLGGPGLDRDGPSAHEVEAGERLDFWEVAELEHGRRLRLKALMKIPGQADLEIAVRPLAGGTELVQTARFRPAGLAGRLYWWTLYPFHWLIFRSMTRGLGRKIDQRRRG